MRVPVQPVIIPTVERLLYEGARGLADVELLAIVMGTGLRPAAALLDQFGGLAALERAGARAMVEVAGGLDPICRVRAALALGRRRMTVRPSPGALISTGEDVYRICAPRLLEETREVFVALGVDCRNRLQSETLVATGQLTSVEVEPRDAFRALVRESAAGAIFAHNHPSGDPTPSDDDRRLSGRLLQTGAILGIPVLDSVVIARGGFASALHGGPVHPAPPLDEP